MHKSVTEHYCKKEKTGITQAALAVFITQGALGVLPFAGLDVSVQQATNLGLFVSALIAFGVRQYYKRKGA